jgi:ribosomal protein S18 acetylase RimI-like enzyme
MTLGGSEPVHVRRLDVKRDLLEVADLIEVCFQHQMDDEGREYISFLRRVGNHLSSTGWVPGCNERVTTPMHGFVWEEEGRIVGNLTIIPFFNQGRWIYMIANVAVLPEHRRRGIGRALTVKALQHIRDHHVNSAWLHVREDNPEAHQLYVTLSFKERARRTTWISDSQPDSLLSMPDQLVITGRRRNDWEFQKAWLERNYPPEIRWNLGVNPKKYDPGFWNSLMRFLSDDLSEHWAARLNGELIGTATWIPGRGKLDPILLAVEPKSDEVAVLALLRNLRNGLRPEKGLVVNYPGGRAVKAFEECGFKALNTLIWMEMQFS